MSKVQTKVFAPFGPDADLDNPKPKRKLVFKASEHLSPDEAIAQARADLEAQVEWIEKVLNTDDDEWAVRVAADGDASEVRIVGKGLVAFAPDGAADTITGVTDDSSAGEAAA